MLSILALIGLAISIYLSAHYFDVRNGAVSGHSSCDISATVCCTCVASSSYAEVLPGVPLSAFGAGGYLAIFLISLFLLPKNAGWRREALRAELLLTSFSVLTGAAYFAVMILSLKTYCLWCLGVDACSLISLALVLLMGPESASAAAPDWGKWKTLLGTIAAAVFVGVISMKGFDNSTISASDISDMVGTAMAKPPVSVNAGAEFPQVGPKDAPITIVEFSDYQCPHCKLAVSTMNAIHSRFPDKVRIVFRFYPLDQTCNPKMTHQLHQFACEAARAAFCAQKQGKYAEVSETIFERQDELAPGKVVEFAKSAGADPGPLAECMSSTDSVNAVARDVTEADNLNITSTPTFYINGHEVQGSYPLPFWTKMIEELSKK
jgi:protein-disulfide isomerase